MQIAIIGATGTIGSAVANELEARGHHVVRASRKGAHPIDIEDAASISAFYTAHPHLDAVVSTAGNASFGPVAQLDDAGFELGVRSKLMGQVNLVRQGANALGEGAAFVLTTGILGHTPWPATSAVAMVNAGLEGFARGAALDLSQRVLVVSPPLVRETAVKFGMGEQGAPAAEVARTYADVLESAVSGSTTFVQGYEPVAA
jgi:NAD(P)-dependent dehydrogenase (short-subunit alcohol dehydrogenase family)